MEFNPSSPFQSQPLQHQAATVEIDITHEGKTYHLKAKNLTEAEMETVAKRALENNPTTKREEFSPQKNELLFRGTRKSVDRTLEIVLLSGSSSSSSPTHTPKRVSSDFASQLNQTLSFKRSSGGTPPSEPAVQKEAVGMTPTPKRPTMKRTRPTPTVAKFDEPVVKKDDKEGSRDTVDTINVAKHLVPQDPIQGPQRAPSKLHSIVPTATQAMKHMTHKIYGFISYYKPW